MRQLHPALLAALLLPLSASPGCSDDTDARAADPPDAAVLDDDAGLDSGLDAGAPDAEAPDAGCEGAACRPTTAAASFGERTVNFEHIFYGLTAPEESESGEWEIYLQAHAGGAAGCPTEGSPTPDATLIVAPMPLPDGSSEAALTADDGVAVSLLDFGGDLLGGPPVATSTDFVVTVADAEVCTECVGQPAPSHPEGVVVVEIDASFAGGTVVGDLVATHCDSMDLGGS